MVTIRTAVLIPALCFSTSKTMNPRTLSLTIAAFSIELSWGIIFARWGTREVFLTREAGQPRKFFSWRHEGVDREVWGLGWYGVTSPGLRA